jgi:hypothetical protein
MQYVVMELTRYQDHFAQIQDTFGGTIQTTDTSSQVATDKDFQIDQYFSQEGIDQDFKVIEVSGKGLANGYAPLIGRILLMSNRANTMLSPIVFSRSTEQQGVFEITLLDQPFDPRQGLTEGMRFGLSAKAQTRTPGFGSHSHSGSFEAGHFSTVLAAASMKGQGVASKLIQKGDAATHEVLSAGITETFTQFDMLPLTYKSRKISAADTRPMHVFWHPAIEGETGPMAADYPDAVKLMMGAGVAAIGQPGVEKIKMLVDHAVKGA